MFVYKKIIAEKSCYGNRYFAVLTHHLKLMGLRPHYFKIRPFDFLIKPFSEKEILDDLKKSNVRKEALTFAYIINLEQKNLHKIYEAAFSFEILFDPDRERN